MKNVTERKLAELQAGGTISPQCLATLQWMLNQGGAAQAQALHILSLIQSGYNINC